MKKIIQTVPCVLIALLSQQALSDTATNANEVSIPGKNIPQQVISCPRVTDLSLNNHHHWQAAITMHSPKSSNKDEKVTYRWQSTDPSLANNVSHFIGAKYVGNAQGHVTCFYTPESSGARLFPVYVYFRNLINKPSGGYWRKEKNKAGIMTCQSSDPRSCPYVAYIPPRINDPYQYLYDLKSPSKSKNKTSYETNNLL